MLATGSRRCIWTNLGAFASWHLRHSAFGSATSWAGNPDAWAAWQLAHFPSRNGACTDFAWRSAFTGAWQEKQRSLPFLTSPNALSEACGEWHFTHSPFAAGTWTNGRASSALIGAWQLKQSSRTGCLIRCFSLEACGVWQAMQLPAFTGAWTQAPVRYFLPKSSWHDSQRSKPAAFSFFGVGGFAARSWQEPQSPSTNGECPTALKSPFFGDACGSWQERQFESASVNPACALTISSFFGSWQEAQSCGTGFLSSESWLDECPSWQERHFPSLTGWWTTTFGRRSLSANAVWQLRQS